MLKKIPGFPDPRALLEEEVAPYRDMTPEERGRDLAAACRAGAQLVLAHPDPAATLRYRDRLPASTRAWMARYGLVPGPDR